MDQVLEEVGPDTPSCAASIPPHGVAAHPQPSPIPMLLNGELTMSGDMCCSLCLHIQARTGLVTFAQDSNVITECFMDLICWHRAMQTCTRDAPASTSQRCPVVATEVYPKQCMRLSQGKAWPLTFGRPPTCLIPSTEFSASRGNCAGNLLIEILAVYRMLCLRMTYWGLPQ